MTLRHTLARLGLSSTFALALAAAAQAQPSSTGGGGSMAYPDSLPSGQVRIPSSTARDTGNMAYPSSPGGISSSATPPAGAPAGKMGAPATTATASPAPAGAPGTGPTPQGQAAARKLATTPSTQPVPYVDFLAPSTPSKPAPHHAKPAAKKPAA